LKLWFCTAFFLALIVWHSYELKHSVTELREEYKIESYETIKNKEKEEIIMINKNDSEQITVVQNHQDDHGPQGHF
jgi:hypothetical protein